MRSRQGCLMSGNNEEDWTRPSLLVSLCALTYYVIGSVGTKDDLAVSDAFAWYWLPNSLFLAALLLNPASRWWQLPIVSIAHVVPLLSSSFGAGAIACSLICNQGFVLCAGIVLRPMLDEHIRPPRRLSLDKAGVTHAIGSALLLVAAAWLLVSLGNVTSMSPAARPLIEGCFAANAFETVVAFATITPAIVCW